MNECCNDWVYSKNYHITHNQAHVTSTLPRSGLAIFLNIAGLTSRSVGWQPVPEQGQRPTFIVAFIKVQPSHNPMARKG